MTDSNGPGDSSATPGATPVMPTSLAGMTSPQRSALQALLSTLPQGSTAADLAPLFGASAGKRKERTGEDAADEEVQVPPAKKASTAAEKENLEYLVALTKEVKGKSAATKGKRATIGKMTDVEASKLVSEREAFGTYAVPHQLKERFLVKKQNIPLFFLTLDALKAAADPHSPISKLLSKLDTPLDPMLDYVLAEAERNRAFARFVKLWSMAEMNEPELEEEDLKAIAQMWFEHDTNVSTMLDAAEDEDERQAALGYDILVRGMAHATTGTFDPSRRWSELKLKADACVQKDRLDRSRSPNLLLRRHPQASELLPQIYGSGDKKSGNGTSGSSSGGGGSGGSSFSRGGADREGPARGFGGGGARGGGRSGQGSFRPPPGDNGWSSRGGSSSGGGTGAGASATGSGGAGAKASGPSVCFLCGNHGHAAQYCSSPGPAKPEFRDGKVYIGGKSLCSFHQMDGCKFGEACHRAAARTGAAPSDDPAASSTSPLTRVVTPLRLSTWEAVASLLPPYLLRRYAVVLSGIKGGFRLGIDDSVNLKQSVIVEPKERYDVATRNAIIGYLDEETRAGRVAGPMSREQVERELGGPFQVSPFKLVDKPGSSKKRFVRDFSAPHGSDSRRSVNDLILEGASSSPPLRTHWHVFPQIANLVLELPPSARVHVADIRSAFRIVPIRPCDRRWMVMKLDDGFYIDMTLAMGLSTATDIFGSVIDLYRDGTELEWRDADVKVRNWVDDLLHIFTSPLSPQPSLPRPPSPFLSAHSNSHTSAPPLWAHTNARVVERLQQHGMPAADEKVIPIVEDSPWFQFLGFEFNVATKVVRLLEKKRLKVLERVRAFEQPEMYVSLEEIETVAGSLVHLAYIVQTGKLRLRAIFAFIASFGGQRGIRKHPSHRRARARPDLPFSGVVGELRWWRQLLEAGPIEGTLKAKLEDLHVEILSDASDSGIGILVDGVYSYWRLRSGWKGQNDENIDYAEALGVELAIISLLESDRGAEATNHNIVAFCDNRSVVDGWAARSHANPAVAKVLLRLAALTEMCSCSLEVVYIASEENDADAVSRGDFSDTCGARVLGLEDWTATRRDLESLLLR